MSVWLRERRLKNGDVDKQWFVDVKFKRANSGSVRVRRRSPVQSKRGAEAFERQLREQLLKNDGKLDEEVKPKGCGSFRTTIARHADAGIGRLIEA